LVHSLVHLTAPALGKRISSQRARVLAVALLSGLIVVLLSIAIWATIAFFYSEAGSVPVLLNKLTAIINVSRSQVPLWLLSYLPESVDALKEMLMQLMREHAGQAKTVGETAGRILVHIIIGMVIGAMAALYDTTARHRYLPLAAGLHDRVLALSRSFERIVFAQVRIAAINAVFSALFIFVALPLAGVHLPLAKTMVAVTFFAGLLPVIGNLISNTLVVVVGLASSLNVAIAALVFLITVHKVEYFLNAKIIGRHINARAWELLAAMLVMETLWGLPGVVAAPVLYAYVKKELSDRGMV
ncbi:MAG: AI-2E family transporter, partial [Janthinobacterium lividum]